MRRREFITIVGGATVTWPVAAMAQEAGRDYRLGMLFPYGRESPSWVVFWDALRRSGFIDGQNLAIDYRDFGPHVDMLREYAEQLVKARPDVLYVGGGAAIRAAQQATKKTPIVGATDDMFGEGLVDSVARPTGNTTGVSILATELDGKRQDILIEALPGLRRMTAIADASVTADAQLHALEEGARSRNVDLSIHRVANGEQIRAAIDMAQASGAAAVNILASPMLYINHRLIMERVAALRLPAMYQWPEIAEEGGFAAYGPRLDQIPELAARQIVKLLRGVKLGDIPVEQPTKFQLAINLKTAKALGLTIPESFLTRADEVIE